LSWRRGDALQGDSPPLPMLGKGSTFPRRLPARGPRSNAERLPLISRRLTSPAHFREGAVFTAMLAQPSPQCAEVLGADLAMIALGRGAGRNASFRRRDKIA
jgi:hypothetical protein